MAGILDFYNKYLRSVNNGLKGCGVNTRWTRLQYQGQPSAQNHRQPIHTPAYGFTRTRPPAVRKPGTGQALNTPPDWAA